MSHLHRLAPALWLLAAAAPAAAQLPLNLAFSFVDTFPGGAGNIGVTQDEVTFDHYVLAFQNAQTVHTFDVLGSPLATFTSTGCTPALPTPNDVTYDPFTETLWLVDNSGYNALQMSRQGACLGGFSLPASAFNPVGICFDRNHGTLFVSYDGGVYECDVAGNLLAGGFAFAPPSGSSILSGITYVPETDRFLLTQSGGSAIYELDRTGALLSTTPLGGFGIGNTQGLHYNPVLKRLLVVDNSLSTTFVFDLQLCAGTTTHVGIGCADGGGTTLVLGATGCADVGGALQLEALATPGPLPTLFAGGTSDTSFNGAPLPLDLALLGGPAGCFVYTSSDVVLAAPSAAGSATLPFAIPNNAALTGAQVFLQAARLDPALPAPLPLATSNYLRVLVN